jgi:cellulose synthase/poly-beta-1,6-N-acetylglucosamine synthase-like glycosyltransferase
MAWSTAAWALAGGSLLILVHTYVVYPVLTAILARLMPRPIRKEPIEPTVSFLIFAHNEERDIARKLDETLALEYPREKLEIIVVSDGSTDRTDEIATGYSDRGVRLFRTEGHPGKTESANQVAPTTHGEILVSSDATGHYDNASIRSLVRSFADPSVGLVSGRVTYRYGESATASGFHSYQRFVVPTRQNEGRFGTQTSVSGSIHAIRRDLFQPAPGHLSFDAVHPLHAALEGYRAVYEADATSEEESRERAEQEFRARVRMAMEAFSFLPYLLKRLPRCKYRPYIFQVVNSKVLRWLSPFFLIVLLVSTLALAPHSPLALILLVAQALVYAAAALGYLAGERALTNRAIAMPLFFVTINLAFLVGFFRWLRGERVATWRTER